MVFMCVICMIKEPPLVPLSAEHRRLLEAIVSPFMNMMELKPYKMLHCADCKMLLQSIYHFQETALRGVNTLQRLLKKDGGETNTNSSAIVPIPDAKPEIVTVKLEQDFEPNIKENFISVPSLKEVNPLAEEIDIKEESDIKDDPGSPFDSEATLSCESEDGLDAFRDPPLDNVPTGSGAKLEQSAGSSAKSQNIQMAAGSRDITIMVPVTRLKNTSVLKSQIGVLPKQAEPKRKMSKIVIPVRNIAPKILITKHVPSTTIVPRILIKQKMPKTNMLTVKMPTATVSTKMTPSSNMSTKMTPSSNMSTKMTPSSNMSTKMTPSSNMSTKMTPSSNMSTKMTPSSNMSTKMTPSSNMSTKMTPSSNMSTKMTPSSNMSTKMTPSSNMSTKMTPLSNMPMKMMPTANFTTNMPKATKMTPSASLAPRMTPSGNVASKIMPSTTMTKENIAAHAAKVVPKGTFEVFTHLTKHNTSEQAPKQNTSMSKEYEQATNTRKYLTSISWKDGVEEGGIKIKKRVYKSQQVPCPHCDKNLSSNAALTIHISRKHKLITPVQCTTCGKMVTNLKYHKQKHEQESKPIEECNPEWFCKECGIQFYTSSTYKNHRFLLKHTPRDQYKFQCDTCKLKYPCARRLQQHIDIVHLKKKKHKCTECEKAFYKVFELRKHIAHTHEKRARPKPHVCHLCGKAFTASKTLEEHLHCHEGLRPFQCKLCPATFTYKAALYTHNKLKHLKIKGQWKKKKAAKEPKGKRSKKESRVVEKETGEGDKEAGEMENESGEGEKESGNAEKVMGEEEKSEKGKKLGHTLKPAAVGQVGKEMEQDINSSDIDEYLNKTV